MYGRQEMCSQDFGGEFRRKKDHLENQGVDGRILLTWTLKKCDEGGEGNFLDLSDSG
jgi:hypothetical protein